MSHLEMVQFGPTSWIFTILPYYLLPYPISEWRLFAKINMQTRSALAVKGLCKQTSGS